MLKPISHLHQISSLHCNVSVTLIVKMSVVYKQNGIHLRCGKTTSAQGCTAHS